MAREEMDGYLFNHCVRTFVWGSWAAKRAAWRYDEEAVFVAAILHDIGLLPPHDTAGLTFEHAGAEFVRSGALAHTDLNARADLIAKAIAIAYDAEQQHQLYPGGGDGADRGKCGCLDVFGLAPFDDLTNQDKMDVLGQTPRPRFNDSFVQLLKQYAARHAPPVGENDWISWTLNRVKTQPLGRSARIIVQVASEVRGGPDRIGPAGPCDEGANGLHGCR